VVVSLGTSGKASGYTGGPGRWSRGLASPNEIVSGMVYGRRSDCLSCAILLWKSRGGEDTSKVCKSSSLEIACNTEPVNTSSLVIDTLRDSIDGENVAVACMYCDFHAHKEQFAAGVLAALLKQLVAEMELMPQEITEAFERAKKEVDGQTLGLSEIRAMLVKSLSSLRRGFICIDALDEFPAKHRPELWDSLQHIVRECPNTRLFITGRPHIREEVKNYFPGHPDLAPINPTRENIRGYITMRLKKDPEPDAMDAELKADILGIILDRFPGAYVTSVLTEPKVIS